MSKFLLIFLVVAVLYVKESQGHGYMLDPPNRSSLWRFDWTKPANYEDNQYFCGGVEKQYLQNGGRCGVCGDNWADPRPRSNENTGVFGSGTITKRYPAGSVVETHVILTANHLGSLSYSLCVLQDSTQPEPEECFTDLKLEDGSDAYQVDAKDYSVNNRVQLPEGVTCEHCVLRWHYRTGNSWGICPDGVDRMGCGDQEIFRSCSDIAIV